MYIIPTYDAGTKTIEVKLAASADGTNMTYKLAPDYRYSVTLKIKPSDAAIREGMSGSDAQQVPDDNTGTHAEAEPSKELGFWSNVNKTAKVTYTVGDIPRKKEFPKPVIQVKETFGNLTLVKSVVDGSQNPAVEIENLQMPGDGEDMVEAAYTFTIKATGDLAKKAVANTDGYEISGSAEKVTFTEYGEDATATVTVKPGNTGVTIVGLPTGLYTITEENPAAEVTSDGKTYYYVSNAGSGVAADVKEDETATATITNTYKPYRTVTITKNVMGPMGDTTEAFDFTTSVTRTVGDTDKYSNSINSGNVSNGSMQLMKDNDSTGSVEIVFAGDTTGTADDPATAVLTSGGYTLADEDSITISKLKVGDKLAITEPYAKSKGYSVTWSNNATGGNVTVNDDMTIDMTITVTNTRDVVPPTGLESNHTKPYALMVGAGALAGLALVGGILARRARRRREW